ncbi:MAG: ABC transporter permease subunit [Erysipelotrichales bacterium]|nr:ABC transporter permease subunit [Erysipelotrichales bacterium]
MKHILAIFKKELDRVFKDKRMILSVLVLPGLMIFAIYAVMGTVMENQLSTSEDYVANIVIVNNPARFALLIDDEDINLTTYDRNLTDEEMTSYRYKLTNQDIDLLIIFDENFASNIVGPATPTNVAMFFNPLNNESVSAFNTFHTHLIILQHQQNMINFPDYEEAFTINNPIYGDYRVFDEDRAVGLMYAMMLPFLIVMFLFAGAMGIGPESIAGEKERGSMATLLVTPAKRSELVLGKVFGLSFLAFLSAVSSFIGIMASLPRLMGGADTPNIYGVGDFALIFLMLVVAVFVIVALISIVSTYAKSVKEASMLVMPLYFLVMLIGITSMFSSGAQSQPLLYLIPLYNTVQALISIFLLEVNSINILLTVISNVVATVILVFLLSKMFNNEKIMFAK